MTRHKAFGLWTALALVVGNMVGAGAYMVPASLGSYGSIGLVGWAVTATGALCLAAVFARLGRLAPEEGGPYAYTRAAFGDFPAFLVAWGYWVSVWVGNAGISTAFAAYLAHLVPALGASPVYTAGAAIAAIWVLTLVNVYGLREAALLQLVTTVLKVLPLLVMATVGLLYVDPDLYTPVNVSGRPTLSAVGATAALTLWGLLGLESVTIPADEVEDPERTIPRATLWGTAVTAAVYLLSTAAVMGVLSPAELAASSSPYAAAAGRIWGGWAGQVVAAGAALAGFGVLNGWVLMQGQMPLAPARDGLFPAAFARLSSRGTPALGLAVSSALATALVLMNYTKGLVGLFEFAALLATVTVMGAYLGASTAQLVFLRRDPELFGGGGARRAGVVSVVAFAYSCWAVVGAGWGPVLWGCVLLAVGVPVYLFSVRSR